LTRFARRNVFFTLEMVKVFYKLPIKEVKNAIGALSRKNVLTEMNDGYMLTDDVKVMGDYMPKSFHSVYALHRNDFLYKSNETTLVKWVKSMTENMPYDHEPLQYLLIDGKFSGAVVGHFRNGPYDLNDIVCSLPDAQERKWEIIDAVREVNYGKMPARFMGKLL